MLSFTTHGVLGKWFTSRLHTRIFEHLGISAPTGKGLVNPPPTSTLPHHCDTGHPVLPDDFAILSEKVSAYPQTQSIA